MEKFKDIVGYEGLYQVSNLGNIKSFRSNKERILKSGLGGNGYLTVALHKDGVTKTHTVHRVVAMAFLGHTPNGYKIVVDHIDNNKLNNMVGNLQLTTARHNVSKDIRGASSEYVGVSWDKQYKKWRASIYIDGKLKHLGRFKDELKASEAYQNELINI
jgi:hypothetical protein